MKNKGAQIILNFFLMIVLTLLILVPPLSSTFLVFLGTDRSLLKKNISQKNILGLEMSATTGDFGNKLRYVEEDSEGAIKTLGFVSQPEEVVLYKDIYKLNNTTSEVKSYEIKVLKVWGMDTESKDIFLYFGEDERNQKVELLPGHETSINLKVSDFNPSSISGSNFIKFAIY